MHRSTMACLAVATILISAVWAGSVLSQPPGDEPRRREAAGEEFGFGRDVPGPGGFRRFAPPIVEAIDADSDGQIVDTELKNAVAALKKLDRNADGELAEEELTPQFPRGRMGPGRMGQNRQLLSQYDKDGDGRLSATERELARNEMPSDRPNEGPFGFGPGGPRNVAGREEPEPGPHVSPADVEQYPDASLYEPTVLRTLFFEFDGPEWEAELADFKDTDVEVAATLMVDGKKYPNVGVHFRGMSSFGMVPAGYKRSLNVSLDFVDASQRLYGYKTLNLLNCNGDPSFLSSVLYSHIARQYIAAPQANLVKVVINGESWGIYANVQQFNKEFLAENFESSKGARWKVSGSPGGGGGLEYLGEDIEPYKQRYEIKSDDNEDTWRDFIRLCKVLNETQPDELESALEPILDIDGALWFLALDVALCNSDGYWIRASDYSIFQDKRGGFHLIPHDMNEAFDLHSGFGPPMAMRDGPGGSDRSGRRGPRGNFEGGRPGQQLPPNERPVAERQPIDQLPPEGERREGVGNDRPGFGPGGFRGGPASFAHGGFDLDPLVGLDDLRKPLRSRLLAVPELRARYLRYCRTIAEQSLDWNELQSLVAQYRQLIDDEVRADTRKLSTYEAFVSATADEVTAGGERQKTLRDFFEKRREFLLNYSPDNRLVADANQSAGPGAPRGPEGPGGPGGPGPPFRFGPPSFALQTALDKDLDGKLSAGEIEQAEDGLRSLDEDQDGKLSAEEIGWPPFGPGGFPGPFGRPGGGAPPGLERPEPQTPP